jgi:hypothetical protein
VSGLVTHCVSFLRVLLFWLKDFAFDDTDFRHDVMIYMNINIINIIYIYTHCIYSNKKPCY